MKFTEGYWLRSEKANILYASQAYEVQEIPGGMRVLAPVGYISSRGRHAEHAYDHSGVHRAHGEHHSSESLASRGAMKREPVCPKHPQAQAVQVEIGEEEAVMTAGKVSVHVNPEGMGATISRRTARC